MSGAARFPTRLLFVLSIVSLVFAIAGYSLYSHIAGAWQYEKEADLDAIAISRAAHVTSWRKERLADALVTAQRRQVRSLIDRHLRSADAVHAYEFLSYVREAYDYHSISIVDSTGKVIDRVGDPACPAKTCTALVRAVLSSPRTAHFSPVYRSRGAALASVAAAIPAAQPDEETSHVLVLEIPIAARLAPVLQLPLGQATTAECFLIERQGESITLVTDSSEGSDASALGGTALRRLIDESQGIVSGTDERGAFIGSSRRLADSDWYVLTRMDAAEVTAPWRHRGAVVGALVFLAVAFGGALLRYNWQREQARHFAKQYAAERSRAAVAEHYRSLNNFASEAILLLDADLRIVEANQCALELYGYSTDEIVVLSLQDLMPEPQKNASSFFDKTATREDWRSESTHKRKDGSTMVVEASVRRIATTGGTFLQSIIRDVTEKRNQERTILTLNRLYDLAAKLNHAIVRARSSEEVFQQVCQLAVSGAGLQMGAVFLAERTEAGSFARIVACEGEPSQVLPNVRLPLKGTAGQHSTSSLSINSGKLVVSNDIANDLTKPLGRALAIQFGYGSMASVPLRRMGEVIGALTLGAAETGFFREQECKLIEMVGEDLSFALDLFHLHAKQQEVTAALQESEALFHRLADTVPAMIWIVDENKRATYFNRRWLEFTGRTEREHLGDGWIDAVHPEDRRQTLAAFDAAVTERKAYSTEYRLRRHDGQYRWFLVQGSPQFGPEGEFTGYIGSCLDVTERYEQEIVLRATEERQRLALQAAQAGTWALDLATGSLTGGAMFLRLHGFGTGETPSLEQVRERLHPDDRDKVQSFRGSVTSDKDCEDEYRVVWPDGTVRWVLSRSRVIADEEGRFMRLVGAVLDVTSRIHLAARVNRAENAFRRVASNSHEGICEFTSDGVVRFASERMAALAGRTQQELIGLRAEELFAPASSTTVREAIAASSTRTSNQLETQLRQPDGEMLWVSLWLSPVTGEEDAADGVLAMVADISRRKRLEEQLLQSSKMEAVGQLAAGVAHDFNNLLTIILGYAQVASKAVNSSSPASEHIRQIIAATERGASLTSQLLVFGRRRIMQAECVDVNRIISEVEGMVRHLIGERITVRTSLAPGLPGVFADRGQMDQVLLNLIVNARDAMPDGGNLTICTSLAATPEGDPAVQLLVSDSGIGIDPAIRTRIFEPFFTTKPKGRGTGLGLSTVYGVVTQAGGTIDVDSEPGYGTTFEIILPAAITMPSVDSEARTENMQIVNGTETILLVEDDPGLRSLLHTALAEWGYRVLPAGDGAEALRIVDAHPGPIHLLLTDVILPGISGPEVAEKAAERRENISVVLMSGYTGQAAVQDMVKGGTTLLEKPFTVEELSSAIRKGLDASMPEVQKEVIVADDDPAIRELLRLILEEHGYLVSEAENGRDLVECLRRKPYEVAITDILMPEQDGLETLMALRKQSLTTRVIVLSGGAQAYLEAARQMGAFETLTKPVSPGRLVAAVQRAVAHSDGRAAVYGASPANLS